MLTSEQQPCQESCPWGCRFRSATPSHPRPHCPTSEPWIWGQVVGLFAMPPFKKLKWEKIIMLWSER